jgi:hypothetical protein
MLVSCGGVLLKEHASNDLQAAVANRCSTCFSAATLNRVIRRSKFLRKHGFASVCTHSRSRSKAASSSFIGLHTRGGAKRNIRNTSLLFCKLV